MPSRYEQHIKTLGSGGGPPPSVSDHFAPKYLVGNTVAGDPAVGSGPPFRYIPDPGDGSGIATALTQPDGPGDIWIRPGTYTLAAVLPAVPAGVLVRGSGRDTTIIIGLSAGDQGVFALAAGSGLHDMTVQSPAPTGATAGSTAMISCTDSVSLERLTLEINPSAGSTLRDAVYMTGAAGPPPGSNATDILILVGGDGTVPGRGLHMQGVQPDPSPILLARNIQIYGEGGLTVGVLVEDAVLVCSQLLVFEYTDTGVAWTTPSGNGGGTLRIDEGAIQTDVSNALTVGVAIQGSGHVLRSLSIACNTTTGDTGIRLVGPDQSTIGAVEIDDCVVSGFANGIVGGENGLTTTSFTTSTITDCILLVASRGVWLSGPSVTGNQIIDNQITVSSVGSPGPLGGIIIDNDPQGDGATSNTVKGNVLDVNGGGGIAVHGIESASRLTVIEGNVVSLAAGGYCISLEDGAERTTCTGNVLTATDDSLGCIHQAAAPNSIILCVINGNTCESDYSADPVGGFPAAIVIEGSTSTVNNNTISTGSPGGVAPGITLAVNSSNNNCVANVAEGTSGTAVTDLGSLNNVSNNIGV